MEQIKLILCYREWEDGISGTKSLALSFGENSVRDCWWWRFCPENVTQLNDREKNLQLPTQSCKTYLGKHVWYSCKSLESISNNNAFEPWTCYFCYTECVNFTLILHNYLLKSPSKGIYCSLGCLIDQEDKQGNTIAGSWHTELMTKEIRALAPQCHGNNISNSSKHIREVFMDYFMNEGAVIWQWHKC